MSVAKQVAVQQQAAKPQVATSAPPVLTPFALLNRQLGNAGLNRVLQAKLTVSDPQDPFEREADHVADQVMRMPDASVQTSKSSAPNIQRVCNKCEDELHRSEDSPSAVPSVDAATESSIQSLSGRGNALPESTRSFMEPRFQADFGNVRVHADAHANQLARSVNAKAFTVGHNVVFAAGQYAPETDSGKQLLAHELTHVVQQGAAHNAPSISRKPSSGNVTAIPDIQRDGEEKRSGSGTWLEIHESVFAYLPARAVTIDQLAHFISGNPDVPAVLAKLNQLAVTAQVPEGQPVVVPIEFIDRGAAIRSMPEGIRNRIASAREAQYNNERIRQFGTVRGGALGPGMVGLFPVTGAATQGAAKLTEEVLKAIGEGLMHLGKFVAYVLAFVAGVIHGFLTSIWDAISGIAQMLYSFIKSIVTGELISDIKQLASSVKDLSWDGIKEQLGEWADKWSTKLHSSNPFVAGEAHGYLTGYVMAEATMLLLSGGTLAEIKGAVWASKLGEVVKGSRALRTIESAVAKANKAREVLGSGAGKAIEALRESRFNKLVKAAEAAGAGIAWTASKVTKVLSLPGDIAGYVAEKLVANVKLLEPFFARIEMLSNKAKRWLFGCNSPCEWEADMVARTLAKTTNEEIEILAQAPKSRLREAAEKRIADTEASVKASTNDAATAQKKVTEAQKNVGAAQELAKERGGKSLLKEAESDLRKAQQELAQAKKNVSTAEASATNAQRAGTSIRHLENELADVERDIFQVYERNGQKTPPMASPDGRELRILQGKQRKLQEDLAAEVKNLTGDWLEQLRLGSPGPGAADKAVKNLADLPNELRTSDGLPFDITDAAKGPLKSVSADHLYPVDKIVREPGFGKLKPDQQKQLLELAENYFPLSAEANSSKGSLTMAEWFGTPVGSRVPVSLRPFLQQAEQRAQTAIRARIQKLLNP